MIVNVDFPYFCLLVEDVCVRDVFIRFGEIHEGVYARLDERINAPTGEFVVVATGVFSCQETVRLDPIRFRERERDGFHCLSWEMPHTGG